MTNTNAAATKNVGVGSEVYQKLRIARRYVSSYYGSHKNRMLFESVKTYCMFIGHARSGHSIIGALLDAHPNIILADEVDALQYVGAGFTREQIYHLILARSERQARQGRVKAGRDGKVYSYLVPGQWQGRSDQLQVIGDSKAGVSTQRLAKNPALLDQLRNTMKDVSVKIICIIRNPYDNISTTMIRGERTFENAIDNYFSNCQTIIDIRQKINRSDILAMRQEDFIAYPEGCLSAACHFLGVEVPNEYLHACTGILYRVPAKSRYKISWTPELIDVVKRRIEKFDFLEGYSYES